ncbi:Calx-beta domain-containing protein [Plantactinospora sp. B6F1]|uniref:Calx-beta domain-containing protein n=1 Tax=Plantactinospora sp. B6F1 TaxID=3158971 RepID=UPI00102B181D
MWKQRLAAAATALVLAPVALVGAIAGPAGAAPVDKKCQEPPGCIEVQPALLGDCWEVKCEITLLVTTSAPRDVVVRYKTAEGSATDGKDFKGEPDGKATIPAKEQSVQLPPLVIPDEEKESDEDFYLYFGSSDKDVIVKPDILRVVIKDGP